MWWKWITMTLVLSVGAGSFLATPAEARKKRRKRRRRVKKRPVAKQPVYKPWYDLNVQYPWKVGQRIREQISMDLHGGRVAYQVDRDEPTMGKLHLFMVGRGTLQVTKMKDASIRGFSQFFSVFRGKGEIEIDGFRQIVKSRYFMEGRKLLFQRDGGEGARWKRRFAKKNATRALRREGLRLADIHAWPDEGLVFPPLRVQVGHRWMVSPKAMSRLYVPTCLKAQGKVSMVFQRVFRYRNRPTALVFSKEDIRCTTLTRFGTRSQIRLRGSAYYYRDLGWGITVKTLGQHHFSTLGTYKPAGYPFRMAMDGRTMITMDRQVLPAR